MINIAYYTPYKNWLGNRMFDASAACNANDVLRRWIALREELASRGYRFETYDTYVDPKKIDFWLMQDPWPSTMKFMWYHRVNPRRTMMCLHEPPVINPWGWRKLPYYAWAMRGILTWHSALCERSRGKFRHYHFPCWFDPRRYSQYRQQPKKNLCLMIHGNKLSREPGELYSLRRQVIRHFEQRGDRLLDLYGYGWNEAHHRDPFFTNLYQGTTDDKWLTYSQYHFTFCIDNSIVPGYITYDPLISMATGTVPVYKPMPDSMRYIPADTFVNLDAFSSLDGLIARLRAMVGGGEWKAMRQRGWDFLNSHRYEPFTIGRFVRDMSDGIETFITGREVTETRFPGVEQAA